MIAATRRRLRTLPASGGKWARTATKRVDRRVNGALVWVVPRARKQGTRWWRWAGRRLRPIGVVLLRVFSVVEKRLLAARDLAIRVATRASAAITPERAICGVILAAATCLVASQFVDYRGVEVGQPGYSGLPAASPPLVEIEDAGQAHAYLLVPVGLAAAVLAVIAARTGRWPLGRVIFALGAASLAVALLIDMPAGLDEGTEATQFAGATAILESGFYAELAAAGGLMLGGLLLILAPRAAARYHARPCRTRTNLFARAASGPRRRRRRRASSRGKGARSGSRRRSGVASAPVSRP